jgi:GTP-binding protein
MNNYQNAIFHQLDNFMKHSHSFAKLTNTPMHIEYKSGDNPFKDKKNVLNARQIAKKRRLMKFIKKKK